MKKVKQEPNAVESFLGLKTRVFGPVQVPDKNFLLEIYRNFSIDTSELCERRIEKFSDDFPMISRDLAWLGVTFFI